MFEGGKLISGRPKTPERPLEEYPEIEMKSVASDAHPKRDEDAVFMRRNKELFGVLDGMGGVRGGQVASSEASEYIAQALQDMPEGLSLEQTRKKLKDVLLEANEKILKLAEENPEYKGMGTTASVVKIWEGPQGERKAVIANVGDSRVYLKRPNKEPEQITLDDNVVSHEIEDEKRARETQEKLDNAVDYDDLSLYEKTLFDRLNQITQALGMEGVEPRIYTVDLEAGDRLIATSDGIHDNLTKKEISQILNSAEDIEEAAQNLIDASQERSREHHLRAKPDDMSVVMTEIPRGPEEKPKEKISIEEAKSFEELFEAIDQMGGLQGTKDFFEADELKKIIKRARAGQAPTEAITRAGGLRDKVMELAQAEKEEKNAVSEAGSH